jgi:quinoprotein dehydrogenase-associated probable ABC transporter substrate-binding protein
MMMRHKRRLMALAGAAMAATLAHQGVADTAAPPDGKPVLAVCADPANLPYSDDKQEGFENKIAALLAQDMQADLKYFWFAEHKAFLRRTLLDGICDVVISVPIGLERVATTKPYFASSYVAVTRTKDDRHFASFDDPWLKDARIGLQLAGDEDAMTPPAMALAHRGLTDKITAFEMWDDPSNPKPQSKIIDAVADGSIDVALVWGPFAGYFAKAHGVELRVEPVAADARQPDLAFVFPMAMAVRKSDIALRDRLQAAIDRHQTEIAAILADYGIPTVPIPAPAATAAADLSNPPQQSH